MEPKSSSLRVLPGRGAREDEVELGHISGIFGVRGEVRLHLHNRESFLLDGPTAVVLIGPDKRRVAATLRARPGAGKRILGAIAGVGQREAAAEWMRWRIVIAADAMPELDDDEFYVRTIEGQPVWLHDARIGQVVTVHALPEVDLFEIALDTPRDGERRVFVPALTEMVTVDRENARIVLSPDALDSA